eukprot:6249957-Karenia_brevis.AAC.1
MVKTGSFRQIKKAHAVRVSAWFWTECILAHWVYFEVGAPKKVSEYGSRLGAYHIEAQQAFLIYRMYEELVPFARLSLQKESPSR